MADASDLWNKFFQNRISAPHIELKAWAYEVDNRSKYLDGAGWAYTEMDLLHVFE